MSGHQEDIRKYRGMIRKLAWEYRNLLELDTSLSLEDLESEAAVFFLNAVASYENAFKASFATYLHRSIENGFRTLYAHTTREKRAFPGRGKEYAEDDLLYSISNGPIPAYPGPLESDLITPERWGTLTEDCRTVVKVLLSCPEDLQTLLGDRDFTKDRLVEYLKKKLKWNPRRIENFLAEIQ